MIGNKYRKLTIDAISDNIKHHNLKNKDVAILLGISEKHLSQILNMKVEIKMDHILAFEDILNWPTGTLLSTYWNSKKLDVIDSYKEFQEIANEIKKYKYNDFNLYDKRSIKNMVADVFPVHDLNKSIAFLEHGAIEFHKFNNDPLSLFWLILSDKKYGHIKSSGVFKKSEGSSVMNESIKIIIDDGEIITRIKRLKKYLDKKGIILGTTPYIPGSKVFGASMKKNGTNYIYLSDNGKREVNVIYSLLHELIHLYTSLEEEDITQDFIYKIINKNLTDSKTSKDFLKILEKPKEIKKIFNYIHDNCKQKINFGDNEQFVVESLLTPHAIVKR